MISGGVTVVKFWSGSLAYRMVYAPDNPNWMMFFRVLVTAGDGKSRSFDCTE